MAAFGGLVITNKGRALQTKAQTGTKLQYTRIGLGDGSLTGQSIADLNGLISLKKSLSISRLQTQPGGKAVVGGVLSNSDVTTGFYFRELGVYAQDPDVGEIMYCYGNAGAGAEYIPPGGGADIVQKAIAIVTLIGNASNVSAIIDSSLVYVTYDELQAAIDSALGAISGGTNQTVKDQIAYILNTDTRQTTFEYSNGVISAIVEKDGAVEVSRTTLNYTAGALTSMIESAGGKTVTSILNRDGNGNLTGITKGVV